MILFRLKKVLYNKDYILEEQTGFTPKRSTVDGVFNLKMALMQRKEHELDSWVVFVDLVKAFDSINRKLLFAILEKAGIPQRLLELIKKLHRASVKLKFGGKDYEFETGVGVLQGDPLAPILFNTSSGY